MYICLIGYSGGNYAVRFFINLKYYPKLIQGNAMGTMFEKEFDDDFYTDNFEEDEEYERLKITP